MATGGSYEQHPSYNNRYKLSSSDTDFSPRQNRLSSIAEAMEYELYFGHLSFSEPKSPDAMNNNNKQFTRMASSESHHSDDVFVDMGHDQLTNKTNLGKTTSTSSTSNILPNPYNKINHKFHSTIWCWYCFYFVFFCCMPAVRFMEMSDKEYRKGDDMMAKKHGRTASACYILGSVLTVVIYSCIFFLIIYFSTYMTS